MPDIKVKIQNIAEIKRAFNLAPTLMKSNLSKAIALSSQLVVRSAKLVATRLIYQTPASPTYRRTGLLRTRINTYLLTSNRAEVYSDRNYSIYVELGTRRMRPRPFMRTGVEEADKGIQLAFTGAVQDTLNKIGRMT